MTSHGQFTNRRSFLTASASALSVGVIFSISPALASNHTAVCKPSGDALQAIVPASKPSIPDPGAFFRADGSSFGLDALRGKGVVLNYWATWCAPCVREMPELDRLRADLKDDGIEVLTVSTDRGGHNVIDKFYKRTKIQHLEAIHDPKGASSRAMSVRGLPTTLIIDRDGYEVARIQGIHHYDTPETKAYLRACLGTG